MFTLSSFIHFLPYFFCKFIIKQQKSSPLPKRFFLQLLRIIYIWTIMVWHKMLAFVHCVLLVVGHHHHNVFSFKFMKRSKKIFANDKKNNILPLSVSFRVFRAFWFFFVQLWSVENYFLSFIVGCTLMKRYYNFITYTLEKIYWWKKPASRYN